MHDTTKWIDNVDKTPTRLSYYDRLDAFFRESPGSAIDKLLDFPLYAPNNMIARFLARYEIFKLALGVHGAVVECGVLSGSGVLTFAHISSILEPYNTSRTIYGFDTFEGFPSISSVDQSGTSKHLHVGGLAADSRETIIHCAEIHQDFRLLNRHRQIQLIKGDITQTVPRFVEDNPHIVVSLLSLDCDLYEPTLAALTHFVPRMPKGGVIVFDELCMPEYPGETVALARSLGIGALRIQRLPFTKISYAVLE